jgi:hypothetical protein
MSGRFGDGLDGGDVVRLMKRHQRDELLQSRQDDVIDPRRLDEIRPAVGNAMADGHGPQLPAKFRPHPLRQMREGLGMAELRRRFSQGVVRQRPAVAILGFEVRRRAEALDLSPRFEVQLLLDNRINRELQARRTGIENNDGVMHRIVL